MLDFKSEFRDLNLIILFIPELFFESYDPWLFCESIDPKFLNFIDFWNNFTFSRSSVPIKGFLREWIEFLYSLTTSALSSSGIFGEIVGVQFSTFIFAYPWFWKWVVGNLNCDTDSFVMLPVLKLIKLWSGCFYIFSLSFFIWLVYLSDASCFFLYCSKTLYFCIISIMVSRFI